MTDTKDIPGFRPMNYPKDLWPPNLATAAGADLYVCVAVLEHSRNGHPKTVLVPIMKSEILDLDWEWVKGRVKYHQDNAGPSKYGKT